jgi:hypothetical protein
MLFLASQVLLSKTTVAQNHNTLVSYSVGVGLGAYACLYLYVLFFQEVYVQAFTKFFIYIIVLDLLLSAFYFSKTRPYCETNCYPTVSSDNLKQYSHLEELGESEYVSEEEIFDKEEDEQEESEISDHTEEGVTKQIQELHETVKKTAIILETIPEESEETIESGEF